MPGPGQMHPMSPGRIPPPPAPARVAVDLTPSEELVLEVLAARWRLGERLWTFSTKHKRAIDGLADKGLVNPMHGIVEKTVRASLTAEGKLESMDESYEPPFKKDLKKSRRKSW